MTLIQAVSLFKSLASVTHEKYEREKICCPRYFCSGLCGKSQKQKHKKEDEVRCEIVGEIFEKRKERRARSAHYIASRIKQVSCGAYSLC